MDVKVVEEPQRRGKASYATAGGEGLDPPIPPCWEEPMPYAVYEALLMGVPVVAFPIGGQADLISQTPSAQFTAEETSAKAFIKAALRIVSLTRQEAVLISIKIADSLIIHSGAAKDSQPLGSVLRAKIKEYNSTSPRA